MKFYASFQITPENCLTNRAISYGDGLFETMLVVNGQIPLWDLHFQRLHEGLQRMNMDAVDKPLIYSKILSLIEDKQCYIVKLVVFRDDRKRGYASQSMKSQFYLTANYYNKSPLIERLTISKIKLAKQKNIAGLKHLNRLEQVLAAQALNGTGYTDALMLDNNRNIIETINKNIILIRNNKLYTPRLNKCGVYGVALRWLKAQGYKLNWKKIELDSLQKYDGMIVCNSIQGFSTIKNINNNYTFESNLSIFKEIQTTWHKLMANK